MSTVRELGLSGFGPSNVEGWRSSELGTTDLS
jgi:hypothetical protein